MRRIKRLEERLDRRINEYDRRLKQLECDHDHVAVFDIWSMYGVYTERCSKCGKFFRENLSEKEYLELALKLNKGKCSKESAELTKRLAELNKE